MVCTINLQGLDCQEGIVVNRWCQGFTMEDTFVALLVSYAPLIVPMTSGFTTGRWSDSEAQERRGRE